MQPVTAQEIEALKRQLVECMASALEEGIIEVEDSKKSAQFILDNLSSPNLSEQQIVALLTTMSAQWPAYESARKAFQSRAMKTEDTGKIEELKQRLQALTAPTVSS
ncbi:MAG: hypothetical protein NUV52_02300 [Candidatus Roizmanbacteria bacterium]|nr:hypothetical protein [Candidatus Roizmanbacteria bacterium]